MDNYTCDTSIVAAFAELDDWLRCLASDGPSQLTPQERRQIADDLGQFYVALDALQTVLIADIERELAAGKYDATMEARARDVISARKSRIALVASGKSGNYRRETACGKSRACLPR